MKTLFDFKSWLVFFAVVSLAACKNNAETPNKPAMVNANDSLAQKSPNVAEDVDKKADVLFINKAADINLEEIQLGLLAQKKGKSQQVKALGKMMEAAHTKTLTELTDLAKTKMVTIPTELSFDARAKYDQLNLLSDQAFDKTYAELMVKGHRDAIALFEHTVSQTKDEEIRDWANKILPDLRKHLEHAEACQKSIQ